MPVLFASTTLRNRLGPQIIFPIVMYLLTKIERTFGLFLNTFIYPFQLLLFFLCNSIRRSDFSSLHGVKPYSYQKQKFEKQKDDTKELDSHTQHSNQKNDLKIMLKRFKISKCLRYF